MLERVRGAFLKVGLWRVARRRVASVFLPNWSTDRLRRKTVSPVPDDHPVDPLVTAMLDRGRRVVAAADRHARAIGIQPGMTITRAGTYVPTLSVIDADPAADSDGLRRLGLWVGRRYSPVVATDPPDGLWLEPPAEGVRRDLGETAGDDFRLMNPRLAASRATSRCAINQKQVRRNLSLGRQDRPPQ